MLKPISRLRSICKGDLNHNTNPHLLLLSIRQKQHVGRSILHSIPVLSIFVLLGIMGYAIINPSNLANILSLSLGEPDGSAYAAETLDNNTSLIIDSGNATDSTATVRNGVAYSSHTVQVKADNITGYSLTITGPTNLSNGGTTISGAGGKTGSTMNDNTWGYGWNTTSTTDANMTYNSFTSNAQTLSGDSVSNNAINFTRKLVFAAKFDQNAVEGHYKANVKLNLTVTPRTVTTNYSVNYNMNGGFGGPSNASGAITGNSYSYVIPNVKPTKTGYDFRGWSDNNSTTVKYSSGNSVVLTTSSPNITLYAVWTLKTWDTITDMQEMSTAICANASVGDTKVLTDARDAHSYTIRKLADGNCWMTTGLMLDLSVKGIATLAASDNLPSDYPSIALVDRFNTATTNSWQNDTTIAQFSKEPKKIYNSGSYQVGSGYFYSSKAATAATIGDGVSSGNAPGSICPKNWHLPLGGYDGDFGVLYALYASNKVPSEKRILLGASTEAAGGAYFLATGYVDANGLTYGGTSGYSLTRTVYSSTNMFGLYFTSSSIYTTHNPSKGYGYPIRCVAYSNER